MSFLKNYLSEISDSLSTQLILQRTSSNNFNVFQYIYQDENKLSDIIADLLNPNGNHGQQDLFLNSFLEKFNIPDNIKYTTPKIKREARTERIEKDKRRIDILMFWNSNFAIAIENKPTCDDGWEQLNDYSNHLNKKYKGKYLLIYLSESEPKEHSISTSKRESLTKENKFKHITYSKDIDEWLSICIKSCQSDKFRHFLNDFKIILKNKFSIMPTQNSHEIVTYSLSSNNNLEAAFEVFKTFPLLSEQIAKDVTIKVIDKLKQKYGADIEATEATSYNRINIYFRRNKWCYKTYCCFKHEDNEGLFLAIESNDNKINDLFQYVKAQTGAGEYSGQWWKPAETYKQWYDTSNNIENLKRMNSEEGVDYLFEEFEEMIGLVDNFFDSIS